MNKTKIIISIVSLFLLLGGLIAGLLIVKKNQEVRRRAMTPAGTATISLNPGTSSLPAGTSQQIAVSADTKGDAVDGFQIVVNITGSVPTDLTFIPEPPTGLQAIANTAEDITNGKKYKIAFLTADPLVPYTSSGLVELGKFTFTSPATGDMTVTYDQTISKIVKNQTSEDIAATEENVTYSFSAATSTTQAWFADDANVGKRIDVYFPSTVDDCVPNSERGNIDVINADSGSAIGKMVDYSVSAANTLDSYWCGHWDNSTAANQLPDTLSNFETGEDFSSWSDGTATWDGGTRVTDNPKNGSYSLKASFTGGTGQALLFNNLGSKAATTQRARFSGYYRTSSTALPTTFQARVVNKNVNNWLTFGAADLAACASGQWCYFEAVVDGHSDSTGTEIDITAVGSGNIDLYLDQLSLQYEDSAPTNILEGAIFRFASRDGSSGDAKDFRIDFGLPQFVSFELVGRGGRSNSIDLGNVDITATPTPVSAVAPNCSNLSGPDAIIVGQTGTFTADYYSPGVALGGEIFWSTNGQTDINRISYQDLTPPTANMSVDWAPTEIGDYVVGCRAWNDAIAECRPAEYVPADHPEITACTGPTVTKSVRVANPSTITPTPTPTAVLHPISWQTDTVALSAEDFYVVAGGETFYPTDVTVHSDPGNSTYTSLEATWYQAGVEMRLFMYFNADDNNWWSYEIRTYNGQTPGDWIYYTSGDPYFTTPIGITHLIKDTLTLTGDNTNPTVGSIYFKNLSLQAFTNLTVGPSLTFKTRLQGITTKKTDQFLRVTLKQNGQTVKTYENVRAIADDEGVYTATISGFTPGTYDVLVKSISHLQRKFTGVSLIDGATAADFTQKVKIK